MVTQFPNQSRWLVDSVRKKRQIDLFRVRFPSVLHVHLTAPETLLRKRYAERPDRIEGMDYQTAISQPNEISERSLIDWADLVFESGENSEETVIRAITDRAAMIETHD